MKKVRFPKLVKLLLILINFLIFLIIIKECKIIGFCLTIFNLISPVIIGFVIAWLLKPIMLFFNKYFNPLLSSIITYSIILVFIGVIGYFLIPIIVKEIINIIPTLLDLYNMLPLSITSKIDLTNIGNKLLTFISSSTTNIKNVIINLVYSAFISYYFLIDHRKVSNFISKYLPSKLINNISVNLKLFVKGTLIDTIILFVMGLIAFILVKMPYPFLFAIVISITNIIPYIGPYIGGIPAIIVAFSVNNKLGLIVSVIVLLLQFIESDIIHPIIMSKSLKINPIIIIIGLIVFGYFFGIIGMLIATPLVSIIKSIIVYYKPFKKLQKR